MENFSERKNKLVEEFDLKIKEIIELNKIDNLEDFDLGLYITNVFEPLFIKHFGNESEQDKIIARSSILTTLKLPERIEQYFNYI